MEEQILEILVVEDAEAHVALIRAAFEDDDGKHLGKVKITVAKSLSEARAVLEDRDPHLIITDLQLPDGNGLELLHADQSQRRVPLVILTNYGNEQEAVEAMKVGAMDYLVKSDATWPTLPHVAREAIMAWQRRMEQRQAHNMLRAFMDHSPAMIFIKDREGRFLDVNKQAVALSGLSRDAFIGKTDYELGIGPKEMADKFRADEQHVLASGALAEFEETIPVGGEMRTFLVQKFPLLNASNEPYAVCGISTDITPNRQAELFEQQLRTILDTTTDLVGMADGKGKTLFINPAGRQLLGYSEEEDLTEKFISEFHPPDTALQIAQEGIPTTIEKGIWRAETDFLTCDGREIPMSQVLIAHKTPRGEVAYFSTIARDISARKEAEAALQEAKDTLEVKVAERTADLRAANQQLERELTERKRVEAALQESETRYRALVNAIPDALFRISQSGIYLDFVPAEGFNLLLTPENFLGKTLDETLPSDTAQGAMQYIKAALETRQVQHYEYILNVDEQWHSYEARVVPDEEDSVLIIIRDVTEQKQAKEALLHSTTLLKTAEEIANLGSWEWDLESNQVTYSDQMCRIVGLDPGTFDGQLETIVSLTHPEDRTAIQSAIAVAEDRPTPLEYRVVRPDGVVRTVFGNGVKQFDEQGQLVRFVGSVQDITEKKQAEETLKMQARVLENMHEGANLTDERGNILYTNPAYEAMFGYERGELIGQHVSILNANPPDENRDLIASIIAQLKERGVWTGEFQNCKKDGTPFTTYAQITSLSIGGETHWVSVQNDITARKQVEAELQKHRERLEELVHARTAALQNSNRKLKTEIAERRRLEEQIRKHNEELEETVRDRTQRLQELERQRAASDKLAATGRMAAGIAHEINNPLASIMSSFQLVAKTLDDKHPRYEYVQRIEQDLERVSSIIRHMYTLYKPNQEGIQEISIGSILREVEALLEAYGQKQGVNLTFRAKSSPHRVSLPQMSVHQVLDNLIRNAIDATPRGEIVEIEALLDSQTLTFLVRDKGPGIAVDVQDKIFEPFYTSKQNGGMGLGLSISQSLVNAMGGTISFQCGEEKGTVFTVVLPRSMEEIEGEA